MRILLVEDEIAAQQHLVSLLEVTWPGVEMAGVLPSVQQARAWLHQHPAPDLVFLDIQLADGPCWPLAEQVARSSPIIFTTAYDQYALRAFDHHSIAYLLKPITEEKLHRALSKYQALRHEAKPELTSMLPQLRAALTEVKSPFRERFLVKKGKALTPVNTNTVAYFYRDTLLYLVTQAGERYPVDFSLEALENQLNPREFLRLNRQVLAHIGSIARVEPYLGGKLLVQLEPPLPQVIVVSQEKGAWLKQQLGG
ncbi:MAG TPA: DNA-binding response regulator [Cytophagales bacterium]|nr:DNA-binding response regulator [Cytophagales bacterium]HAA20687.1 DNA-binding response regulator [Cytophagales bacterium]HAP65141.1 DNA-binding response regulator [Cytophagales bacterium]